MNKTMPHTDDPHFLQIDNVDEYMDQDLARTHTFTASEEAASVDPGIIDAQHQTLLDQGYVIIRDLLDADSLQALRQECRPHLGRTGRNSFEGALTQRIYAVPEKLRSADPLIEHPMVLAHLDRLFQPNYLLSQAQVINILPGSPAQPLHVDDGFYPWPRPRPPLSAATVFAVDDFTFENGATVAIPGSHRWDEARRPSGKDQVISAEMPAGSCILFLGTLWHGGGANTSDGERLAVTAQYCEPWVRTQENFFLSVSRETAAGVSENIRRLLGYSIHPPFMGMTDGMHPKRKLPRSGRQSE